MAWNRPSEEKVKVRGEDEEGNFHLKGFLAGVIVVVGAAVAVWWLWPTGESAGETPPPQKRQRIKEASPLKRESAPRPQAEKPKDPPGYWNGKKISNENRPPWMSPYHRVMDYGKIETNIVLESDIPIEDKIFELGVDQQIASMLLIEPGTRFFGNCDKMYTDFDEDFAESLKSPIIVRADDPEEVKALKRAVIEVKADLKARKDAGESLQRIMEENWKEMRELGLYKHELNEQLNQLCEEDEDITEQDLEDYVTAANTMLRDRGCAEMKTPVILKEQIKLRLANRGKFKSVEEGTEVGNDKENKE